MAAFRWIQMVLLLILMLQFKGKDQNDRFSLKQLCFIILVGSHYILVFSHFVEILFCILTAQIETQRTFLTVRDGNEVTLPCGNRRDTQDKSDETSWFFNNKHSFETRDLVKLGNSHREMKTISDRLSVTANGSLLLHKVTEVDAGLYTCRWTISGQHRDFAVYLSVITSEHLHHVKTKHVKLHL